MHGLDGLDELSSSSNSHVAELKNNKIIEYIFNPQDIGYELFSIDKIKGGDAKYNAKEIIKMLHGDNNYFQQIVEINSGAVIYLSGIAKNIKEGSEIAKKFINNGKAKSYFESLIKYTNN